MKVERPFTVTLENEALTRTGGAPWANCIDSMFIGSVGGSPREGRPVLIRGLRSSRVWTQGGSVPAWLMCAQPGQEGATPNVKLINLDIDHYITNVAQLSSYCVWICIEYSKVLHFTWCKQGLRLLESWTQLAKSSAKSEPQTDLRLDIIAKVMSFVKTDRDIFINLQRSSTHLGLIDSMMYKYKCIPGYECEKHVTSLWAPNGDWDQHSWSCEVWGDDWVMWSWSMCSDRRVQSTK